MFVELIILFQGQALLTPTSPPFRPSLCAFHCWWLLEYPIYSDFLTGKVDGIEAFSRVEGTKPVLILPRALLAY